MKVHILILFTCTFIFNSCLEDECSSTFTYQGYEAVYMTEEEIKDEITFVSQRNLENPGKIYYYENYLLISEKDNGVHIIDNSNVREPRKLGFINIPGNQDISLSDHYIYADTRYNIVIIDIETVSNPQVVNLIENVKDYYRGPMDDERILVDFALTDQILEVDCNDYQGSSFWDGNVNPFILFVDARGSNLDLLASSGSVPEFTSNGLAGSLSRMALFDDHFYYINDYRMQIFDVKNLEEPVALNELYMDWGIETIFPYQDKLFIGARNGMHIFDNRDPGNPEYLSTFSHANACDPVVVQNETAYITLRNGSECENFFNQLDVVDLTDLLNPQLIASFPMHHPHGLSIQQDILYICEADEGFKVYDARDPKTIDTHQIAHVKDYFAVDVISVSPSLLLMVGNDGFFQFDTSDPSSPILLSAIRIGE